MTRSIFPILLLFGLNLSNLRQAQDGAPQPFDKLRTASLNLSTSQPLNVPESIYQQDFDYYWHTVKDNFAYFDKQKTNWNKVKDIYQPMADTISSRNSFISFLEKVNNELYNGHVSLNTNLASSPRLIPTGADLWIVVQKNKYVIAAVRENSNAEHAGLKGGMILSRYNDIPVDSAIRMFLPQSISRYDNAMYEYAANMLLAGTHDSKRKISVIVNGTEKTFLPDEKTTMDHFDYPGLLDKKILAGNIGYIRINNSLGDMDLIGAFDKALDSLWNTSGMVIDLRETPSGGNTTVARAIMSRFISKELPYQKHSLPSEEIQYGVRQSWVEYVSPRGRIYQKPLVVLVNHWTGSMGEGIAIGFDGMKRAMIAGDRMAGLLGAIYSFTLPGTHIGFSIPAEKLYHINGTPREDFMPRYIEGDCRKQLEFALGLLRRGEQVNR